MRSADCSVCLLRFYKISESERTQSKYAALNQQLDGPHLKRRIRDGYQEEK